MLRSLAAWLVLSAVSFAVEPEKSSEPTPKTPAETSPEVETIPPLDEFLLVPLKIYRLKSEKLAVANCVLTDRDFERIVGKVNGIWAYAGIHFALDSIVEETADAERLLKLPGMLLEKIADVEPDASKDPANGKDAKKPDEPMASRFFRALIPTHTRRFDGFRVYYVHDFDVNGIYYGNREAIVKETAALRQVPGGIDEPLPRVTAHELGHGLGLPHRQDRTNLLQSGTTGTTLNEEEVAVARKIASQTPGMIRYASLNEAIKNEKDDGKRKRLEAWKIATDNAYKSKEKATRAEQK